MKISSKQYLPLGFILSLGILSSGLQADPPKLPEEKKEAFEIR